MSGNGLGEEYGLEHTRTWEFNQTAPIRSIAIPYVTIKMPLNFLRFITLYARFYLNVDLRTSYMLLVYPRLIMVLLSFVNDWALFRICRTYGLKWHIRLASMAGSHVLLVFGGRTFSNSIEMALCSLLLYIVADCMANSNAVTFKADFLLERYSRAESTVERVKLYKMIASLPAHSLNKVGIISTICVVGFFNRPTFIVFGMPIVFFWLLRGLGSRSTNFLDFNLRIGSLVICAIPTICVFIMIDSLYYDYLSPVEVQKMIIGMDNFVVTPLNFIRYNMDPENTGQHGTHPKWLHLLVNVPLLFNVLGITAIVSFGSMLFRFSKADYRNLPRAQSVVSLMNAAIFVPVLALSYINHQEPRFILPIMLPIFLLHAPKLQTGFFTSNPFPKESHHLLTKFYNTFLASPKEPTGNTLKYWYLINFLLTIFFGFVHQGGVLQLTNFLSHNFKSHQTHIQTHLVTSNIYAIPTSLLFMPSTKTVLTNADTGQKYHRAKRLFIYEYGSSLDMDQLYRKLKLLIEVNEKKSSNNPNHRYQLLLAIPSSLSEELSLAFWRSNSTQLRHEREHVFYPHLSVEAMPRLTVRHPTEVRTSLFSREALAGELKCTLHQETNRGAGSAEMWHAKGPSDMATSALRHFSSLVHQFGLALYRIESSRNWSISQ